MMVRLGFLEVEEGDEYGVWAEPEDALQTISEELSKDGVVMVSIMGVNKDA